MQCLCFALFFAVFVFVAWPYGPRIHAEQLAEKEWLPLELFLWMDPLSGIATAIAGRVLTTSLVGAVVILAMGTIFPRAFCGFICPLGTLHDLFEWAIGKRIRRWNITDVGGWRHLRFYILAAVLVASVFGVTLAGYVAAIPVLTRGMMFSVGWLQNGLFQNWDSAGPFNVAMLISTVLFFMVMATGLLGRRFWCRYLCPTGAIIGLAGLSRANERHVRSSCTECGLCIKVCGFDAINKDISTRVTDCASCHSCVHVCPQDALYFGRPASDNRVRQEGIGLITPATSRRAWLCSVFTGIASAVGLRLEGAKAQPLLRPPGSVPEKQFLDLCVRCGECFKVCPGAALQPAGLEFGLDCLWTPRLVPTHAACHPDCNFCTQACPTGAIRPLSLPQKRRFVIGIARIDPEICLPHKGERDCQLCFDECRAAGYDAIEMRPVKLKVGSVPEGTIDPAEVEAMGTIMAPGIIADRCVGCGLCEYRCHAAVHLKLKLIPRKAVWVEPPPA